MPVAGKSLYKTKAVTIDISESTTISTAVDTDGLLLSGIIFPAAMTGTAITFQVASTNTGGTIKIVSGSAEAADRVINLVFHSA